MAHEYAKEAKASHGRKLESYGAKAQGSKFNDKGYFDGADKPIGTDEQRGLKPLDKEPELSKETAPRIMRKVGGKVSLKRLDKAPRRKKDAGGSLPSPEEAIDSAERLGEIKARDVQAEEEAAKINRSSEYSDADRKAKRAKGGKVMHDDEPEDRALIKKMIKPGALTGKKDGGKVPVKSYIPENPVTKSARAERKDGGAVGKGRTAINIVIAPQPGQAQQQAMPPMPRPMAPPPPAMPPQMPPVGMAPPMGAGVPPAPMGAAPLPRKDGGKVQVPYKKPGRKDGYPAMDFGAGGGFGRKQKIDAYGSKG